MYKKVFFPFYVLIACLFACGGGGDCTLSELEVEIGECNCDGYYELSLNFDHDYTDDEFFEVYVRNNELLGYFTFGDLPLSFEKFKISDEEYDYLKVCVRDEEDCCKEAEFFPPKCDDEEEGGDCEIFDLIVETGECGEENTYALVLDFEYKNPSHERFEVFIRNKVRVGNYSLEELPLTIEGFERSGSDYDYIQVCFSDDLDCCAEIEFMPPECEEEGECELFDLNIETGECDCEDTYGLTLDFEYSSTGNEFFELSVRNDELIGFFKFEDLPLSFDKFERSGKEYDFIKICVNDNPDCCVVAEFMPPECEEEGECSIEAVEVTVGECNTNETFVLELDFEYEHADNEFFDLFTNNNQLLGFYKLSDLPLKIEEFPLSGYDYEYLKICINDNPDCCKEIEFMSPDCSGECELFDLVLETGECTSENTYVVEFSFEYENVTDEYFDVFVRNNEHIGYFSLDELPVAIEEFELSGNDYDFIKICINDNPDCCVIAEFMPPECEEEGVCEIFDVVVETGECTSDGTYVLELDFEYDNTNNESFDLFIRNNQLIGSYYLEDLPLTLEEFPVSGSAYDFIKVCINDDPECCYEIEYISPDC